MASGAGSVKGPGSVDADAIAGRDVKKDNLTMNMNVTQPPASGDSARLNWLTETIFKIAVNVASLLDDASDHGARIHQIENEQSTQSSEIAQLKRGNALLLTLIIMLSLVFTAALAGVA